MSKRTRYLTCEQIREEAARAWDSVPHGEKGEVLRKLGLKKSYLSQVFSYEGCKGIAVLIRVLEGVTDVEVGEQVFPVTG